MPGLAKLGSDGINMLETEGESYIKSKSSLTEALKWSRETAIHPGGLQSLWRLASDYSLGSADKGSHESEHDLAAMVQDFMENGSSGQDGSCYSSDSDSGTTNILKLVESIKGLKTSVMPFEKDLLSLIHALILSNNIDFHCSREGICKASCIRKSLVKHLRSIGYIAAVCKSEWKGTDKVPGGEYEYIDVILEGDDRASERLIIDIDFQSHFEIARPTLAYLGIVRYLPVVYVGNLAKLEQILEVMVEAAKISLKQNSMPLPPWRTLGYLRAKWLSSHVREPVDNQSKLRRQSVSPDWRNATPRSKQRQCSELWRRLKASLLIEVDAGCVVRPVSTERNRNVLSERRPSTFNV
jgi:uncharacterized protein (TIGR01615 family)